jgi:4-azaleucine resistance transporter AzlC
MYSFLLGIRDCIPTLLGYLSIGFACGVVGKTSGLSIAEIILMSTFLYAGSAQFIVAGMMAMSSSVISIIITVFFVNMRHVLLSAAIAPYFRKFHPWRNALLGAQLTDETFGVAILRLQHIQEHKDKWLLGLNMTAHVNWVAANIVGAFLGAWIPDPEKYGLDYALPAMFVGLLVMQLTSRQKMRADLLVVAGAVVVFIIMFMVMPGNMAVIAAIIAAAILGMVVEQHGNKN